jgi:hypothetical protein
MIEYEKALGTGISSNSSVQMIFLKIHPPYFYPASIYQNHYAIFVLQIMK